MNTFIILYLLVALVISFILSQSVILEKREIKEILDEYESILSRDYVKSVVLIVINLVSLFWIIAVPGLIIGKVIKDSNLTKEGDETESNS